MLWQNHEYFPTFGSKRSTYDGKAKIRMSHTHKFWKRNIYKECFLRQIWTNLYSLSDAQKEIVLYFENYLHQKFYVIHFETILWNILSERCIEERGNFKGGFKQWPKFFLFYIFQPRKVSAPHFVIVTDKNRRANNKSSEALMWAFSFACPRLAGKSLSERLKLYEHTSSVKLISFLKLHRFRWSYVNRVNW